MAGERDDERGVMGNLPRSRPGRRSEKRSTGSGAGKRKAAAVKQEATAQRAKRTARTTAAKRSSAGGAQASRPRPQRPPARAQSSSSSGDPISQAVQLAGKVAALGVNTAAGIIKRLPGR